MGRICLLAVALLVVLVVGQALTADGKTSGREKQRHSKQVKFSKAEGSPKEAKYRYSKHGQDLSKTHKSKKSKELPLDSDLQQEWEQKEPLTYKLKTEDIRQDKKAKKTFDLTEELVNEEPILETKYKSKNKKQKLSENLVEDVDLQIPKYRNKRSVEQIRKERVPKIKAKREEPVVEEEQIEVPRKRNKAKREAPVFEEEEIEIPRKRNKAKREALVEEDEVEVELPRKTIKDRRRALIPEEEEIDVPRYKAKREAPVEEEEVEFPRKTIKDRRRARIVEEEEVDVPRYKAKREAPVEEEEFELPRKNIKERRLGAMIVEENLDDEEDVEEVREQRAVQKYTVEEELLANEDGEAAEADQSEVRRCY